MTFMRLTALVSQVVSHVEATKALSAANMKEKVVTHPIPFFGDIVNATVATVGLNPSATEFERSDWPKSIDADALTLRLVEYFKSGHHAWFDRWEEALSAIGASYRRNAVHLDISPRATLNASSVRDRVAFDAMCRADLPWLIRFIDAAPNLRLILLAGTAPTPSNPLGWYMNRFVARRLPTEVARLEGSVSLGPGTAKVKDHVLVIGSRQIPVYFCSSSPSDRMNPVGLQQRLAQDSQRLRGLMADSKASYA